MAADQVAEDISALAAERDQFKDIALRLQADFENYRKRVTSQAADEAHRATARLVEELAIVQPKIVVVMGEPALRILNGLSVPLSRPIEDREGEIQAFTPTIDALYTPDIDDSLDEEGAKQRFWRSFRMLGKWYEDLPPY